MSALISSSPGSAASAIASALSGSGASTGDALAAEGSDGAAGAGSFGALFQHLLGRQAPPGADLNLRAGAASRPEAAADEENALTTLLPFLDALGLIPAADEQQRQPPGVAGDALAGIASALTPDDASVADPAAISAASAPAPVTPQAMPSPRGRTTDLPGATQAATPATRDTLESLESLAGPASITQNTVGGAGGPAVPREMAGGFAAALEAAAHRTAAAPPPTAVNAAGMTTQPATPASAVPALPVTAPVGAAHWGQEVGNRVMWMAHRLESRAELVLTPAHMGRVEVSLSITGDHATASFVSGNPAVREALEAALPRLRELLAEAGVQLGQTQVGAENARQSAQQDKNGDNFASTRTLQGATDAAQSTEETLSAASGLKMGRGLVDVFA